MTPNEMLSMIAQLRRERDEAREEVASLRLEAKYHDEADALRKLRERERDEAREEWGKASMDAAQLLSEKTEAIAERDELRELVKAYQDYAQLLGDEINDMTAVAYVHGWRSNRYEQGKVLRDKIKQLEGAK